MSPSCPFHTVSFDRWPLLSLSGSYVYSLCRKELFPVEQKSLWEQEMELWKLQSACFHLRVQKEFRGKTKQQNEVDLEKPSLKPLTLPNRREKLLDGCYLFPSLVVSRASYAAMMMTEAWLLLAELVPTPHQHRANVLPVPIPGECPCAQHCLYFSLFGRDLNRKRCRCVYMYVHVHTSQEVQKNIGSDRKGYQRL